MEGINIITEEREWSDTNHNCVLRRSLYFPIRFEDVDSIHDLHLDRYKLNDDEGVISHKIHWTALFEVVEFVRDVRPTIICKDTQGFAFKVCGYFDYGNSVAFESRVASRLGPGRVLALRYGQRKTFLDSTRGIRIEDDTVSFLTVLPGPLNMLLKAADFMYSKNFNNENCWNCNKQEASVLSRCGRCKHARYCSRECQQAHWNQHRQICKYVIPIRELVGEGVNKFDLNNVDELVEFPINENYCY